ncbi:nucleotidyltransferase domain-containing protein [Actinoplanes sp. N902-109]|uniref:nucleotidyltransferase domain-containing protein n=1 Tax=Actinoplanes sp. (strain N902-109) TaxID=649831 RepID=UPI0003294709|nr:nucleotidyltransferase domain-containing protein [Actinoplanes sp. N902-109]AGL20040.1 hypothetical protein L083_6530 [Actinoplanes sp. N902-109]
MTVVDDFGERLAALDWVSDLLVAGSLATGDYTAGVSDLDLVALTDGPVGPERQATLVALHRQLDAGPARGLKLGCVYVDSATIAEPDRKHPTWTHGVLVQRILSGVTRVELGRHGYAVFGRTPGPAVTDDDVRAAAKAELTGYWTWAAWRPWIWLDPAMAELGLTSMARGRHALTHGDLLTKTAAIRQARAPRGLLDRLAARRRGEPVPLPRVRAGLIAWLDAVRTVSWARRAARRP